MKTLLTILSFIALAQISNADEQAIATAQSHLNSFLKRDIEELAKSYAPKIMLMAGNEFLEEQYGLAKDGDSAAGLEVERGVHLAIMKKTSDGLYDQPVDQIEELLESLEYQAIETKDGDFSTTSPGRAGRSDGKLHFKIKAGDVLLKVSPKGKDYFLLLHLRKFDGSWKIFSECF